MRDLRSYRVTLFGRTYERGQITAAAVLIAPTLVALLLLFVIPVVQVVYYSFTDFSLFRGTKPFNGLGNFKFIFTDSRFYKSILNTFTFATLKLVLDTVLALALALMLDSRVPLRRGLRAIYFAPVVVPVVASSLIWLWFYDPGVGPFNQILSALGLPTLLWLNSSKTALMSIVIFSVWKGVGYNMILFLAGLQNIPDSYIDAAKVDGASGKQILFKVKLPLLRPIILFVVMIGIINSFKVFAEINVMTPKGGPLYSTALIVNYIYEIAFSNGRFGRGCAAALILFIIIFILTTLQNKLGGRKTVDYS